MVDEKEALTPLFSLFSLVPTGGHQPHDSVSLPVGPSVIPLLFFSYVFSFPPLHPPILLSVRLTNSDMQEAKKSFRKQRWKLSGIHSGSDPAKRCIQWQWTTWDILAFILEIFCNPTGFLSQIQAMDSGSKCSLLLLLPHHLSSYRQ